MKTEPEEYGLDDLKTAGVGRWDGVRNYQARNRMKDARLGDHVLIYHSGKKPAIVGIATIDKVAYDDPAQFDPNSDYFDAKATKDKPRWVALDLRYESTFKAPVLLATLKSDPRFEEMEMLRQSRLSVSIVEEEIFQTIVKMGSESEA